MDTMGKTHGLGPILYSGTRDELQTKLRARDDEISRLTEENERLRKVADDKLGDFYLEAWEVAADALHKELLLQVEHLMDSKEGTPAAQHLSYLAELVGAYEEARFGVEE